jgi:hypothetical protein
MTAEDRKNLLTLAYLTAWMDEECAPWLERTQGGKAAYWTEKTLRDLKGLLAQVYGGYSEEERTQMLAFFDESEFFLLRKGAATHPAVRQLIAMERKWLEVEDATATFAKSLAPEVSVHAHTR